MSFHTNNELDHFRFQGAYIGEFQQLPGSFTIYLDNVIILPENTTNRDIREMRCNNLELRIENGQVQSLTEEGYKVFNANGDLMEQHEDTLIEASRYQEIFTQLRETPSIVYSIEQKENHYLICIDGEEHTYVLDVTGSGDSEDWDRYLNVDSM